MTAERWRRIELLYYAALEREAAERFDFLTGACAGDDDMRREIESLLACDEDAEHFIEALPVEFVAGMLVEEQEAGNSFGAGAAGPIPRAIGAYRILRLLGQGGMGVVYEAEQQTPHRIVALKVIKPGFASEDLLRRFEQEGNALGRLQHPGIAQIYDAGTADAGSGPQPYFAMELIHGSSLQRHAETHHLNTDQRLELMGKVCEAVHHAHQRGLIHRDLKPGNILVDETGQPKIVDFGVARVIDSGIQVTRQTDLGQLLGTLAYMSPEQVMADPLELDTRSDVYALGVILYELLAGRLPYKLSHRLHESVQTIREQDPTPLSSVSRKYRGDIETIVAKALEKDKARRYASAAGMAADIRRYLADEPIAARPPSASYQLHKFARRHKAFVVSAAVVFLVLMGGIGASTREAMRANRAGQAALADRDRATAAERAAMQERDRALVAERVATTERNRALAETRRADTETATARAINDFLQNDLLAQAGATAQARPDATPDPDLKVRTALDRAAARIADKFAGRPLVEAAIRQTIGDSYEELGLYPEAERHVQRALDLRHSLLGANHPDTLFSMNRLGEQYLGRGKYEQAEKVFDTVLEARRRVLGAHHVDTLNTMNDLAAVYRAEGNYPKAERLNSTVLALERRVLGEKHLETLNTVSNLAQLYADEGKYGNAEDLYTNLLELEQRVLGEEHPLMLPTMHNLASVYRREGKYGKAEDLYVKLLDLEPRVLGKDHPDTATSMSNLALLYRQEGKYKLAEDLFTQSLEIQRRVMGNTHPTTLVTMSNLAALDRDQDKNLQAEALFNKVLEVRRLVLGEAHPDTLKSLNSLAVLYRDEGNYARAEPLFIQVIASLRRLLGEEHPNTLVGKFNLAAVYREEGNYIEAEPLFINVVTVRRRVLGEEHPESLRAMHNLAVLYRDENKYPEAEALLTKVLEVRRRVLGGEHPDTLTSINDLALLYELQGKDTEAEQLLIKVLEVRRRVLGAEHRDTANVLTLLSQIRLRQKKYDEAEPLLRQALTSYEKTIPDSWRRYDSQSMLGASLAGLGKYAEAEPMLLSGYQGMLQRRATIPASDQPALERAGDLIVQLYQDLGRPERLAEWRQQLTVDRARASGKNQ